MDVLKKIHANTETRAIVRVLALTQLSQISSGISRVVAKLESSSIVFVITDYSCFCTAQCKEKQCNLKKRKSIKNCMQAELLIYLMSLVVTCRPGMKCQPGKINLGTYG